jgi:hypothetical protein
MAVRSSESFSDTVQAASAHLNQIELAYRWRMSPRTLERWRWLKIGPAYLRIGGRIVYRLEDIQKFEADRRRGNDHDV